MSFLNLGTGAVVLGLAAIAALLYFLQRLRIQYREVEVVTTLFWKQAVEETRARALVKRFRHPLAYLLALAISALVWLAYAEPRRDRSDETDYVILLDGSAGMDWGDRFERAKALVQEEASRLPKDRRRVYFCGAEARLILDRDEEAYLLEPRLEQLTPVACPASINRELLSIGMASESTELQVLVVGDAPVGAANIKALPDSVKVVRLRNPDTPALEGNAGIAAIGLAEAASGAFDRVDVMVDVKGRAVPTFVAKLGDSPLDQSPISEGGRYFWRDTPARGNVFEIALTGVDPLPVDDRARISLPARASLSVAIGEGVSPLFLTLVEADPGLAAVDSGEPATIAIAVGDASSGIPTIEIVSGNGISIVYAEDDQIDAVKFRFANSGLERVGRKVSDNGGENSLFNLTANIQPGTKRAVRIGEDLLGGDYDFASSSAFPIFVSRAIRWLSNSAPVQPFAAAGERLVGPDQLTIAGASFAPPQAGEYRVANGQALAVSVPAISPPTSDPLETLAGTTTGAFWPSIASWCILLALVLIGAEWWLFQKGRIP